MKRFLTFLFALTACIPLCAGGKNLENIKAILEDKNYVGTTIRG